MKPEDPTVGENLERLRAALEKLVIEQDLLIDRLKSTNTRLSNKVSDFQNSVAASNKSNVVFFVQPNRGRSED